MVTWKPWQQSLKEAAIYIKARQDGILNSLKTAWPKFNLIGLNGLEWNSMIVLASRPGVGKTLLIQTITRDLIELNPKEDFLILNFQFEMLGKNLGLRELSSKLSMNIRRLQAVDKSDLLTPVEFNAILNYINTRNSSREFIIDKSMTVAEITETCKNFYDTYKKPFVVTLDHTLLIVQASNERERKDTLQNLALAITYLKNNYPIIFIILSQLNREIDNAERQIPRKQSNYPTEADVYGSDFLLQCTDIMIAYNKPSKYNLAEYGPKRYQITPFMKNYAAAHVLKNRFGNTDILWYDFKYETMSIVEVPEPVKMTI